MIESVLEDFRIAFRTLARAPGFSVVVLTTLAVGIGATTAIFSVVNAVLLSPLAYPNADEIVSLGIERPDGGRGELGFSDAGYQHFRDENRSFAAFGAFQTTELPLSGGGEPIQLSVGLVTNSVYEVLGVSPLRGRLPSAQEDLPGGPLVTVLSYGLWVTRFASDPDVVGTTVSLDDRTREVIGVMPREFEFPGADMLGRCPGRGCDLWVPLQLDPASQNIGLIRHRAVGRLAEGATIESATADADDLLGRLRDVGYGPEWFEGVFAGRAYAQTMKESVVGGSRRVLLIVLGAVSFVLLIACVNVASLFLVRADARVRQTAMRVALGATRLRVVQSHLAESVLLASGGCLGGLLLAYAGLRALVAAGPVDIPRLDEVQIRASVFWYTVGASAWVGIVFGLLPALGTGRDKLRSAITDGGRGSTPGRGRVRARGMMVASEVALALVLLIGSGLMVRSFQQLRAVDPGFDPEAVITFGLTLPATRYPGRDSEAQFFDQLLDRFRALPGVEAAGATTNLPMRPGTGYTVEVEGFPTGPGEFPPIFAHRWVTPGYFDTMGISIVEGRDVERADHQDGPRTLFISSALKDEYWPTSSAIGKRMRVFGTWGEVAGVVSDVRVYGLDAPLEEIIYLPLNWPRTASWRGMSIGVRAEGSLSALVPDLQREVAALDPALPLSNIQTMEDVVGESMSRTSFTMLLLVLAAVVAAFLGSVGIYGLLSYVVGQRTEEFGVRAALGADSAAILLGVLKKGMVWVVLGTVVGLGAAAFMSRLLTSLLFGVTPFDPLTFVAAPIVFLVVAAGACIVPARRAAAVDPAQALRAD